MNSTSNNLRYTVAIILFMLGICQPAAELFARVGGAGGHSHSSHSYSGSSTYSNSNGYNSGSSSGSHRHSYYSSSINNNNNNSNSNSSDEDDNNDTSSTNNSVGAYGAAAAATAVAVGAYDNAEKPTSNPASSYSGSSSSSNLNDWSSKDTIKIAILVCGLLIYYYRKSAKKKKIAAASAPQVTIETVSLLTSSLTFPDGLDYQKVSGSFLSIQDAWQKKDLSTVRKWLSDGMYQRLSVQFMMMDALDQRNMLSNIRINQMVVDNTRRDGYYHTAEVAISFNMSDSFISTKYPQFNESYPDDGDIEYWTFIKRTDSAVGKNLYDNNCCPNCGAPLEIKMGEISRCSNCNTLTNNASYDWVLCEITQEAEYNNNPNLSDYADLKELLKHDPYFAVQRMEDIASNVFMQVMEVYTGGNEKRLSRFADEQTIASILTQKKDQPPFIFDRLYIENVTLNNYSALGDLVNLYFILNVTYRRVSAGEKLEMIDPDFVTHAFRLELSRNITVLNKETPAETVYSYECSSCGAPFTDTTEDHCTYCDAPVVDKQRNWVLTAFVWR